MHDKKISRDVEGFFCLAMDGDSGNLDQVVWIISSKLLLVVTALSSIGY